LGWLEGGMVRLAEWILDFGFWILDSTKLRPFLLGFEDELVSEHRRPGAGGRLREGPHGRAPRRPAESGGCEFVRHRGRLDGAHAKARLLEEAAGRRAREEGEMGTVEDAALVVWESPEEKGHAD